MPVYDVLLRKTEYVRYTVETENPEELNSTLPKYEADFYELGHDDELPNALILDIQDRVSDDSDMPPAEFEVVQIEKLDEADLRFAEREEAPCDV